ncbi:MAG TPA: peptide-methionine (R)-S-oxide reductase MsrB [Flavilitoribacter sp.]|nr:peptide-methionine (R)-S-oxide reductase MsrB [Lewinella sp.]MCB9278993.1 peptide-methionine (R)-S-oxide reductase MsrB [Lewinellaceae bacterium]HMQ63908.1 peptide-methionine (R)-S-oxide reductase MsrB [Flavilitoribacter sp.]HMQ87831.1 peptide-methionine (R)-S-oxide reductase MsrB [Flavilitoribacter sp.]
MRFLLTAVFGLILGSTSCQRAQQPANDQKTTVSAAGDGIQKVTKSDAEWKSELTDMEYYVLRQAGTERAFSGKYWDNHEDGIYTCAACGLPLFDSKTKFESGTGWPSFYEPIKKGNVIDKTDKSHGMVRSEVLCARCEGHLGHVFDDGPAPTGLRYCMNSVSLDFIKRADVKNSGK